MSVIQSLRSLANLGRVTYQTQSQPGLKPYLEVESTQSIDMRRARISLLNLYRSLEQLADVADVESRFKLDLPDAVSNSALALDLTTTAASLNSVEEINMSPMSFTPFGPEWSDGSSASVTIGGEYDGTHGTDTLGFIVTRDGTHGTDDLRIRFEDSQGGRITDINVRRSHVEDRQYSLDNGLFLTLGPGSLTNLATTSIQVFDNVGAAVDPDRPLGGIRNSNPNLEYNGPSIVDGSFSVNGQNINVATTDSLNDVVSRINQSTAGVTATFNAALERIEFLQNTLGSVPTVDLQGDTSNFLQATKLDTATVVAGIDPDTDKALQDVAALSTVQNGNFLINGQQINVDAANDSLTAIIDKINASSSGAVASFDAGTKKILIEASDAESVLELDSNGTGLFAALKIPEGRVDPEAIPRGVSRQRSYEIADATAKAFEELSYLFQNSSFLDRGRSAGSFRSPLEGVVRSILGDTSGDLLGLRFDGSSASKNSGRFASVDRHAFTQNLQLRGDSVRDILSGSADSKGLIEGLLAATRQSLTIVNRSLGISGSVIDTFA